MSAPVLVREPINQALLASLKQLLDTAKQPPGKPVVERHTTWTDSSAEVWQQYADAPEQFSREFQAGQLAELLSQCCAAGGK